MLILMDPKIRGPPFSYMKQCLKKETRPIFVIIRSDISYRLRISPLFPNFNYMLLKPGHIPILQDLLQGV